MNRSLLTTGNVIIQGITGTHGAFHTRTMLDAGTVIVGGTSPNKAGELLHGVPVFATIADILDVGIKVDTSVVFVPAAHAKAAVLEALEAEVKLIVIITEGIPVHDMLLLKRQADEVGSLIIGPNCPGIYMPDGNKLGIIPANFGLPGSVGIVSRSGTLTYEAMAGLSDVCIGQRYVIGIGGDRVKGTDFTACLKLFEQDPELSHIVLIGEIGGQDEQRAADYIRAHVTKPVFAYVAGHSAPAGVQLGHAGAILGSYNESAQAKTAALAAAGVMTAGNITELTDLLAAQLKGIME